jgi:threonine synthase
VYLANSMNSLRLEGQKTVAIEIAQQLGWEVPDWVVIPGGNLGNVSALGAGFEMLHALGLVDRRPRICVAQAAHASPLANSFRAGWAPLEPVKAKTTLASAIQIGNPVSFAKAVRALRAFDGVVETATEAELADAAARADRAGLFACPHTGVALAALEKLAARGDVTRDHRVVVIRLQGRLPRGHARRGAGAEVPQHAGRAARSLRRRPRRAAPRAGRVGRPRASQE